MTWTGGSGDKQSATPERARLIGSFHSRKMSSREGEAASLLPQNCNSLLSLVPGVYARMSSDCMYNKAGKTSLCFLQRCRSGSGNFAGAILILYKKLSWAQYVGI